MLTHCFSVQSNLYWVPLCYVVTQYYAVGLRKHEMFGSISPQRCSVEIVDLFFQTRHSPFFWSNFLTGCQQEDSTGRKRLKPRGKPITRPPFPPLFASNSTTPLPLISLRWSLISVHEYLNAGSWLDCWDLLAKMTNTKNDTIPWWTFYFCLKFSKLRSSIFASTNESFDEVRFHHRN